MTKDELANELEQQSEEESQAATMRRLRAENKRLHKQVGNIESLVSSIIDYLPAVKLPAVPKLKTKATKREQEMVALLSDTHATEAWTADQTDGATWYNFERFCQLLYYYGQEIVRFANEDRGKCGLKVLHIDMLGDLHQGVLRLDDEVTNDFPTVPGMVNTASVLWQWLVMLSEHFERIECVCMAGNHGRLHDKPQSRRYVDESRDTLIHLMLRFAARVAGAEDRIRFTIPRSRNYTHTRLGHRIQMTHGDMVRGGNSIAGIPIYGLSRKMLKEFRKEVELKRTSGIALMEYGHWHQTNFLHDMVMINGALCPTDPWAFDEVGALSHPKQYVYYTSQKYAVGWECRLRLKDAPEKHGFRYDKALMEADE